ncbi:glycosyltransferase family 2 protein [Sphingomonas nostoxanthinifaciens]|uniref:glycosyltransferase family 2 protein n=1 Tax=Sphingomonas nostoxanthinifaciens TaxID=2872652 RepID=UPI001CC1D931|nr:glycosyltransferase family 2 protein [Sphingomonas nostoxanthinifaciens]UAK24492.1 glycosyltransferase family 2 protein [Sphingomonas nostoxanthinifaciens]
MAETPHISLIVPVKDEEEAIAGFVARVGGVLDGLRGADGGALPWEILFVDDGSQDATLAVIMAANARDRRIVGISLSRNFGKEAALSAGLDTVRGQAVVPIDVDLQDPPEVIGAMLDQWRQGYEVVYGVRRNRMTDSLPKRLTADLYYRAHNWLSEDKIPEHAGDFRLLDRKVVDVIRAMPERNRFMKGLFAWGGFRQTAVEYDRAERAIGTTKFNYIKLWKLAIDGLTSASTVPLRVWSYMGAVIAVVALAYAAYLIGRTILYGVDVAGYASMMVAVLFLGGVQLLSLGVLGEYVGRILIEAKGRPIYVIRERIGIEKTDCEAVGG